jgi:arsenical pump membrane protein
MKKPSHNHGKASSLNTHQCIPPHRATVREGMNMSHGELILLGCIVAASLLLMLWRPKNISEAWWIGAGVALLLATRLLPIRTALTAVGKGTDVYLFLTGMLLLSELAREQGVFDWLAAIAMHHANGSAPRLLLLVYASGIVVTALLSNDATAVVMTPAVLAAIKQSDGDGQRDPAPFLFACAMIANAASFLLPISNPANLVVFAKDMPPLGQWLAAFLLPSLASIAVTYIVLRLWFRRELQAKLPTVQDHPPLTRAGRWVLAGLLVIVAVLLTCSALHRDLGAPTCIAAILLVLLTCARSREGFTRSARTVVTGVSWSVLPLVAGLFCLVEVVSRAGLATLAVDALQQAAALPKAEGVFGLGMSIGILNNLVNNLPLGLLAGTAVQQSATHGALAHAILIAVDLGPNLSVTGSLATILWLMRIRREGVSVSGSQFLRVGLLAMPLALAASLAMLFVH